MLSLYTPKPRVLAVYKGVNFGGDKYICYRVDYSICEGGRKPPKQNPQQGNEGNPMNGPCEEFKRLKLKEEKSEQQTSTGGLVPPNQSAAW